MLEELGMQDCNPAKTPLPAGCTLHTEDGPVADNASLYRSILGNLANSGRPDIAYAVGELCFM